MLTDQIKHWFDEIKAAKKRDEKYIETGKRINKIYEAEDTGKVPFNILYSNTDTLVPALYSAQPRPVIQRRFKDEAPLSKAACEASRRMLEYLIDTNIDGYETFGEAATNAVIDALLPGRGVTRIKYDAEVGEYLEQEGEEVEPIDGDQAEDAREPLLQKEAELICIDSIVWDKVLFGYARKWSKVPWIVFEEVIDKDEAIRLFGEEVANRIVFTKGDESDDDHKQANNEDQGERKTAVIYQIWDKDGGRKVRYVTEQYKDDFLKVEDDPLELSGFYPIPRPLQFVAKSNQLAVTAPYLLYENQAKEINELTIRISKIANAIKAKFVYDAELGDDISNLMTGDDLEGIPADKSSAISADKGFEASLWFMPIDKLVAVLQELYAAREQCKQVIYEVTGISDIIRGSTVASETATAQSIKSQWGTMRLKRSQGEVQRYCRDMMRIMLEIAATKFSEDSWVKITSLPYATEQQVMQAQMVMQAAQQYQPMPGEQPNPQLQQTIQQAQMILQQPQWSQILGLLRDDLQKSYQVDVETNSTVMPEATEDKQNATEALTALGSFIKESLPVVQAGILPFPAFKQILMKITRQFQFGDEIETEVNAMQMPPPPQQPQDNTLQVKQIEVQAKQAADQMTAQLEQQKLEMQRLIEEGKAKTQMHIESLRIESQKELEAMRIESQQRLEQYKAELSAKTQLEIAIIGANATAKAATEVPDTDVAVESEANAQILDALTTLAEKTDHTQIILQAINRPKRVVRGPDGSIEGVE